MVRTVVTRYVTRNQENGAGGRNACWEDSKVTTRGYYIKHVRYHNPRYLEVGREVAAETLIAIIEFVYTSSINQLSLLPELL